MKNNEFIKKTSRTLGNIKIKVSKHSPEILMVAGLAGTIIGTILACKSTDKAKKVMQEKNETLDKIHECHDLMLKNEDINYSETLYKKDLVTLYTNTGVKLFKVYSPTIGIMTLSFASIIAGNNILRKRNVAIAAAYALVDKSFKNYRNNVIERFGEDVDKELRYNIAADQVKKNGKKKNNDIIINDSNIDYSEYARFFDAGSSEFQKDPEYNLMFLRRQQDYANDKLKAKGHLFLNEVYDMLDIPRTKAGQVVGWIYKENNPIGDNYVDFGLYNKNSEAARRFVNGMEYNILLDFNVDGVIYDLI